MTTKKCAVIKTQATVRIDAYEVISRAVEAGIGYGWRRAHKHTNKPSDESVYDAIFTAVMNEICEVVKFDI